MSRSVVMIVVLALGLVAGPKPEAGAHAAGTIKGIHYASIVCVDEVQGIPQPDPDNPEFFVQCSVQGLQLEILCQNPANNDVRPGNAATQIVVKGQEPIEPGDFISGKKSKGRATKAIEVSTNDFLRPEFCVNPNWNPIAVLLTELRAKVDVFQCVDGVCPLTPTSTEEWHCVIPPGFSVANPPPAYPDPDSGYDCTQTFKAHLQ